MTAPSRGIQKALKGMDYPTDKRHLVERARSNHADEKVVSTLDGPNEVQKAVFNQ
ncbi:DUF2795 domain-containing protein [Streptomyces afghaniensis]